MFGAKGEDEIVFEATIKRYVLKGIHVRYQLTNIEENIRFLHRPMEDKKYFAVVAIITIF